MERVCVTGATGFIASWVIKLLLERGSYIVHATLRSLKDPRKTEHLLSLDGAKERLRLFEANLMEEGSFDYAIQGCHGVFHVASPVIMNSPNPKEDIIEPAVKGTLNVLNSCAKVASIKRVVLTSSTAAVTNGRPMTEHETLVDETWFSTPQGCEALPHAKWYLLSKTMAEEAAWKFAKEKSIDMVSVEISAEAMNSIGARIIIFTVSINPAVVIGPFSQSSLNYGASRLLGLINGEEKYSNKALGWVHIKHVAEAHVRAFEIPSANGRYILSESVAYLSQVVDIIKDLYPTLILSDKCGEKIGASYELSKTKARSLGINYIPMRDALKETIECLKYKKFMINE